MPNTVIEFTSIEELNLDPKNPRLGRDNIAANLSEVELMKVMGAWALPELATSFLESGFFPQEALIVVNEKINKNSCLVVIEGNRRLATLKFLYSASKGENSSKPWKELAQGLKPTDPLFTQIPYIKVDNRKDVSAYLGFRHVSGIKEWRPAEKAQFITKLIDEENLTYDEVRRKIGSKTPTVRQLYIAYKLLLQMEQEDEIDVAEVEKKFSVLYLSLRTEGVRKYLNLNLEANPTTTEKLIAPSHEGRLINFSRWMFGTDKQEPLFSDSRKVDEFGKILLSTDAVSYLERTSEPRYEMAYQLSGGSEDDVSIYLLRASDNIREALAQIHLHKKSESVQGHVERVVNDTIGLLNIFPKMKQQFGIQS